MILFLPDLSLLLEEWGLKFKILTEKFHFELNESWVIPSIETVSNMTSLRPQIVFICSNHQKQFLNGIYVNTLLFRSYILRRVVFPDDRSSSFTVIFF